MKAMKSSQISISTLLPTSNSTTIQRYQQVKGQKSEDEKDMLIEKILRETEVAEALYAYETIPGTQRKTVSEWAGTMQKKSSLDESIERLNKSIKQNHPDFCDFGVKELFLIFHIQSIDAKNIHVYANKLQNEFTCWFVCAKKDYGTMDKISELVVDYELANKTCVHWLFMSEEQYACCSAPKFAFYC